jgi:transketolase
METPIPVAIKLAKTPTKDPKYAQKVKLSDQSEILVADPTATRAMIALMDMQAVLGGAAAHFGGPSAFAEIMSALHGVVFQKAQQAGKEWYEVAQIVNDAGHCENGLYALKANYGYAGLSLEALKGFRSIKSPLTGHGETHLFPEGVYISNGPLGSGLPQAQGLAFADALAKRERVTVCTISDGGCMEGEARESLAAIPGLAAKGRLSPFMLIISDNNTKLSGRIDEEAFSMAPTFNALEAMGWAVVRVENGHDLQACVTAIEAAFKRLSSDPKKPIALHVKTIKGFGTKKTMASASGAHGFPLKNPSELTEFLQEIYNGKEVPKEFLAWVSEMESQVASRVKASTSEPKEKVQVGISKAMISRKKMGLPIVSISSDLAGSTGVAGFQKEFPNSSQDLGVAEANMISTAIGLSKEGFIPVVDTFSQFGVTKGALPLIMSALSQGPVICVFSHAGFQDAADGASHQALSYFAMTVSIPQTDVFCLTSSSEAESLFGQAIDEFAKQKKSGKVPKSYIFFLGREDFPKSYMHDGHQYKLGSAQVVFDNTDKHKSGVTILAAGALLHQALEAAKKLEQSGIAAVVINPSIINRPDVETIKNALERTAGKLLTVEDHQLLGGMGATVIQALVLNGVSLKAKSLAVRGEFGQSSYMALELYHKHGLDAEAIYEAARWL